MKSTTLIVLVSVLAMINVANAQSSKISFHQGDRIMLNESDSNIFQINIKPEPFTIIYEGIELNVCTGLTKELFLYTKAETDINKDFNSYFYIFKYMAMSKGSEFLPVEKDMAASLNITHGAKRAGPNKLKFKVSFLRVDDKEKPLSEFKQLHMALWLDSNKDQYIDETELLKVRVNIDKQ
ncbi:MAG: hypothetical protein ABJG78_13275 [Cyclobacteriaceae bacterium]